MWLTNHRPYGADTVGWDGHLTRKIVSIMTYNVSSETLDPTIVYRTICKKLNKIVVFVVIAEGIKTHS